MPRVYVAVQLLGAHLLIVFNDLNLPFIPNGGLWQQARFRDPTLREVLKVVEKLRIDVCSRLNLVVVLIPLELRKTRLTVQPLADDHIHLRQTVEEDECHLVHGAPVWYDREGEEQHEKATYPSEILPHMGSDAERVLSVFQTPARPILYILAASL